MKYKFSCSFTILMVLFFLLSDCSKQLEVRTQLNFNKDWLFSLTDVATQAESPSFEDSQWRVLNVPHDWAIEGDFDRNNPAGTGGGALPGGMGWYRKHFEYDKQWKGKMVFIDFDGVYMDSKVWINGNLLGHRPYGYASFRYNLTPHLKEGENIIAVQVNNSQQPNSRWYSGAGIYRNVRLVITNPVYVDLWGTYITTPKATHEEALVKMETKVKNETDNDAKLVVNQQLLDSRKDPVGGVSEEVVVAAHSNFEVSQILNIKRPILWSLSNPYMYEMVTTILQEGEIIDEYRTPLGIRTFDFDADRGFFLNGEAVKIQGVCNHHDLGCLGAAVNVRALERQLELLKEMGCNGIRTSHNPPAPELLDLCDRMGFIVQDEAFDMWRKRKTSYDYARFFNEWHERDLTDMILRDRNHPSVFMWSIGNEVLEQWNDVNADTLSLDEANFLLNFASTLQKGTIDTSMHVNSILTLKLAKMVKKLDPTRPVTSGNNNGNPDNYLFRSGAMDIIGLNYNYGRLAKFHEEFPGKKLLLTESTSALQTRGYYRMPSDSVFQWPTRWDRAFTDSSFSCSSYDNCRTPWGNTHEQIVSIMKKYEHISGTYVWTGFDYLGEPTPFGWPARSSYFGIIDLAGFPKDSYYMYQSEWSEKDVLHLFPHWNWKEGEMVDVWAYYSNADEVELYLNGVSQGVRKKTDDVLHAAWRVPYEPGVIKAISRRNGKMVLEREVKSAGEPAMIELIADRLNLKGEDDLSFVTVNILDEEGTICPNADNLIEFEVSGNGFLAGVDNGSPISIERFKDNKRKAYYGKCLAVLQAEQSGSIQLKATSVGLKDAVIIVKVK